MTIITIQGGLGNQLFQYAAAFAAARRKGDALKMDLTGFGILGRDRRQDNRSGRQPDILDFGLSAQIAEVEEVEAARTPRFGYFSERFRQVKYKYLVNYYIDYSVRPFPPDREPRMDGYFQTERYFVDAAPAVFEEFQLRDASPIAQWSRTIASLPTPVSIHVRRGDYVDGPGNMRVLDVCGPSYYSNALEEMRALVGRFTPVVFSDDITWVRENLQFGGPAYFPGDPRSMTLGAAQELALMSRCSHHIIANSTFSWWGAYLNRSPTKVVVAPEIWVRGRRGYRDIIPKGWRRVPV